MRPDDNAVAMFRHFGLSDLSRRQFLLCRPVAAQQDSASANLRNSPWPAAGLGILSAPIVHRASECLFLERILRRVVSSTPRVLLCRYAVVGYQLTDHQGR